MCCMIIHWHYFVTQSSFISIPLSFVAANLLLQCRSVLSEGSWAEGHQPKKVMGNISKQNESRKCKTGFCVCVHRIAGSKFALKQFKYFRLELWIGECESGQQDRQGFDAVCWQALCGLVPETFCHHVPNVTRSDLGSI